MSIKAALELHMTTLRMRFQRQLMGQEIVERKALSLACSHVEGNGEIGGAKRLLYRSKMESLRPQKHYPKREVRMYSRYYIKRRHAPRIRAAVPVQTPLQERQFVSDPRHKGWVSRWRLKGTYISHCSVENFTASTRSLSPATSCSILVSVSLMRISWPLASSRILPFSRFRSRRTDA